MKKEFLSVFQLSKTEIFEVDYYTLGNNQCPHFSTSACVFNRPKTDYNRGGQCQEDVTKSHRVARNFYKKWDNKHLCDLTLEEYQEMIMGLELLKEKYNYVLKELDELKKPYNPIIPFHREKELSMLKLPNRNNKPIRLVD